MPREADTDTYDQKLAIKFPNDDERQSLHVPKGFKKALTWFLDAVYARTGYKCSKNEFAMKAMRFYLDHLLQSSRVQTLLSELKSVPVSENYSAEEQGGVEAVGDTGPLSEKPVEKLPEVEETEIEPETSTEPPEKAGQVNAQ